MSRFEARSVLDLLRRLDEPEHNVQERNNMIQELRALGLRQVPHEGFVGGSGAEPQAR
jgi:hypothetical protein